MVILHPVLLESHSNNAVADVLKDVTILSTLYDIPPRLELTPRLECVHLLSAGSDHIRESALYKNTQIPITTSSGIHGPIIGEWVIMMLLTASHKFPILYEWRKEHNWNDSAGAKANFATVSDLVGKRLGILGYGSIGRQVARNARAFGMEVIAFTRSPRLTAKSKHDNGYIVPGMGDPDGSIPNAWFSGLRKESLHEFLNQDLDYLLVSIPLNDETRRLLGRAEFDILSKKNAFIVNVARGDILVQEDLIEALRQYQSGAMPPGSAPRGLRGAAMDVATPEPLPRDNDLWNAPNCMITPHMSGSNIDYAARALRVLEKNLEQMAANRKLLNLVNRQTGYASSEE
ncbi:MAG: hypothetical protein Q9162_003624 [Coniocarpon cinnabarinum]